MELLSMFLLGLAAATTVAGLQSAIPLMFWGMLDRQERIIHGTFVSIWLGSVLAAALCLAR